MKLSREQMLAEMGIKPLWRERDALPATDVAPVIAEAPPEPLPAGHSPSGLASADAAAVDRLDWPQLAEAVAACRACVLCEQRKQAVLGVGDRHPEWLFIGEGPGAEEDARGEPFVGQAGKLLDNMLAALGLARGDGVYIANAVKCRPPGNRTPEAGEMAACRPWLERQVALLQPKVIVLLGKAAVHALLHEDKALAVLRGKRHEYRGIPAVVTYHPAYLLRNLPEKARVWADLRLARRTVDESAAAPG